MLALVIIAESHEYFSFLFWISKSLFPRFLQIEFARLP